MSLTLQTILALVLFGIAPALPQVIAQDLKRLSADELRRTLSGNTITGKGRANCTFFDYYTPDGSAASRCGDYSDTGKWEVSSDDKFCLTWSKRSGKNCIELYSRGDQLLMKNPRLGDDLHPLTVLNGDARK